MPFEKFKEKHGGQGPASEFYDAVTGGAGVFGRHGLHRERDLTEKLIEQVTADEALSGLHAAATAGRSPKLTVEQHEQFRAGLQQAVMNQQTFDLNYKGFVTGQEDLTSSALTETSKKRLNLLSQQGEQANRYLHSGDPTVRAQGAQLMSSVLDGQRQFSTAQETAQIQQTLADENDRDGKRKEFQTQLNSRILSPLTEDSMNYAGVQAQLSTGKPDELVPNHILGAALEYTNAALKQADDGNWTFRLGPVGIGDDALPKLTFSQVRNLISRTRDGRVSALQTEGDRIGQLAQQEGYAINGTSVDDVVYPLTNVIRREQEQEFKPASIFNEATGPETARQTGQKISGGVLQIGDTAGHALLDLVGLDKRRFRQAPSKPAQGGPVSGIIQRPTND